MCLTDSKRGNDEPPLQPDMLPSKQLSSVLSSLHSAVASANRIPRSDQLLFLKTISPNIEQHSRKLKSQLLKIVGRLTSSYTLKVQPNGSDSCSSSDSISFCHVKESIFNSTTDAIDEAIDRFNNALDTARGIENAGIALTGAIGPDDARKLGLLKSRKQHLSYLDIEKPQVRFPDYPIDNSDTPFVPPCQNSNGSQLPAGSNENGENNLGADVHDYLRELYRANSKSNGNTRHPFEEEILAATSAMSERQFHLNETTVFKPMDQTPFTFITTEEQLFDAVERIKTASELAVDLENHSVRSFQGFTCLMQLSTRREDFVIDLLALRGSIQRALSPIFTDASTVKVLHGADYDIQWLERDFGIYVVNMFDTGQAARLLQYPSAGLWYLLSQFCSVSSKQKRKYQLADWRVRPIPDEMLAYARSDTHYLLYIYDRLRDDLSKKGLLSQAWEKSAAVCRKRYVKPRFHSGMARELAARHGLGLDAQQMRLLEVLCSWRDSTAREEDESLSYVSPLPVLFGIVLARDKARTVDGLFSHGIRGEVVPPLIRSNSEKIVQFVCDALDAKMEDATIVLRTKEDSTPKADSPAIVDDASEAHGVESKLEENNGRAIVSEAVENDEVGLENDETRPECLQTSKVDESKTKSLLQTMNIAAPRVQRSVLFGSDFEISDSESDERDSAIDENEGSGTKAIEVGKGTGGKLDMECDHSVDSEKTENGEDIRLDLVAKVQGEISMSLREQANRCVTMNVDSAEGHESEVLSDDTIVEREVKKEENVLSLEEMYGRNYNGTKVRKRKRRTMVEKELKEELKEEAKVETKVGTKMEIEEEAMEELEAFDYKKAKLENVKIEQFIDQYDPSKVRHDRHSAERARLRKRRKGRAKAMTFKSG